MQSEYFCILNNLQITRFFSNFQIIISPNWTTLSKYKVQEAQ
jgi:hypothetical protein